MYSAVLSVLCVDVKVNETEVYVDGHDFKFYSSPYYLRLFNCFANDDCLCVCICFYYLLSVTGISEQCYC